MNDLPRMLEDALMWFGGAVLCVAGAALVGTIMFAIGAAFWRLGWWVLSL